EAKKEALRYDNKKPEDIIVVPNTIHPEIYNKYSLKQHVLDKFKERYVVLYLGDTGLRRGTACAIRAVDILKDRIPEVLLIMVGKNKVEDPQLRSLIGNLGLEEWVSMEGWQDVSLFPSYVKAADVCISPLKHNLHHNTTYANKIFQYMALGKPLVVSDSTAQQRVVENEGAGLVHEAENERDLANKIMQLYENPSLAKKLGNAGKKAVEERWNWKNTSQALINMYGNL
ncbi:MAG: glycosyltransferase, partial [Fulvivirga sp.]|nr:glycosyltransferase [Fulvivirga sp.]